MVLELGGESRRTERGFRPKTLTTTLPLFEKSDKKKRKEKNNIRDTLGCFNVGLLRLSTAYIFKISYICSSFTDGQIIKKKQKILKVNKDDAVVTNVCVCERESCKWNLIEWACSLYLSLLCCLLCCREMVVPKSGISCEQKNEKRIR